MQYPRKFMVDQLCNFQSYLGLAMEEFLKKMVAP